MLGTIVQSYLSKNYNIIPITRANYDLNNLSINTLSDLLLSNNIEKDDVVINCAGIIPQASKHCDLNNKLYFKINSLFPVILSMLCDKYNCKMIHITTDCVFSGKDGQYDENSPHDETNDYGVSKSLGELCNCTIIRTSIIGEEINNKRSLLEWVKSNKNGKINGYTNHIWNGVTCLQLAKIIYQIISENLFWQGVRHIYSPKKVNKFELVSMINTIYDLNITINEHRTDNKVDKSIVSIYENNFQIPDLSEQIKEQKEYNLVNLNQIQFF